MKRVVLVGNSNVGKSSLTQWLLGRTGTRKARYTGKRGKRPGTTLRINPLDLPAHRLGVALELVDFPGFGFMKGVAKGRENAIKDRIVHYLEIHASEIALGVVVVNVAAFPRIVAKWEGVQIPLDLEFVQFFAELGIRTCVVANKLDKVPPKKRTGHVDLLRQKLREYTPADASIPPVFAVSLKQGTGLNKLMSGLKALVRDDIFTG